MISNELLKYTILKTAIYGKFVKTTSKFKIFDLDKVVDVIPTKHFQIKQSEIKKEGKYPVVSQSQSLIEGYSNDYDKVFRPNSSCVIFGDHSKTIKYIDFPFIVGADGTKVIQPKSMLNSKYLYYHLIYNVAQIKSTGYTRNFKYLKKLKLYIPPLEEQEKIVKKIEELFELIDKKEKNDKEKEKLKTLLKEKILDSAIHGKLVENDLSLPAIDVEEVKEDIPFDVPINWKWSYIENCVQINPRNKINDEIIVGFVPMTNILGGYESKIVFESKKWKYVKKGYTHIKTDDVIVAKITPCFENRKSAYIKHLPSGYGAGTTEIHVLRNINNKMYMKYLLWFVKTNYFIKDGQNHFTGTAGQQRISKQWLSKFLIPVPPLEQQKKIVEKIEECFKLIEQL